VTGAAASCCNLAASSPAVQVHQLAVHTCCACMMPEPQYRGSSECRTLKTYMAPTAQSHVRKLSSAFQHTPCLSVNRQLLWMPAGCLSWLVCCGALLMPTAWTARRRSAPLRRCATSLTARPTVQPLGDSPRLHVRRMSILPDPGTHGFGVDKRDEAPHDKVHVMVHLMQLATANEQASGCVGAAGPAAATGCRRSGCAGSSEGPACGGSRQPA